MDTLSIIEASKSFGKLVALNNVSLEIKPGTITTLIGPSGAGKTTLLKAMSLLDPPDTGIVSVDGFNYSFPLSENTNFIAPWPKVTVVFQQLFLWPHLSLKENIELPIRSNIQDKGLDYANQIIDYFQMRSFLDRYPNQVSAGQRQLCALVRAIALKPKYILIDEVTAALDVEYIGLVLDELKHLKMGGSGILLITHLLGFAKQASDQIAFIDQGKVLELGGVDILIQPRSERLRNFLSRMLAAT